MNRPSKRLQEKHIEHHIYDDKRKFYLGVAVAALAAALLLVVDFEIISLSRAQAEKLFVPHVLLLVFSWLGFFAVIALWLADLKMRSATRRIEHQLKAISEAEDYTGVIDGPFGKTRSGVVAEINNLVATIKQKNQQLGAMASIIEQREQENQVLWLEIEHNLCLAKEDAERDGLTNLYNRRWVEERFVFEIEKAGKNNYPISVLMCDLDHFKQVNDVFGHQTGDDVLRIFADTLRASIRANDIAARYGGEEFIIVLPETPVEAAMKVAQRINSEFTKAVERELPDTKDLSCTVSIGLSDYPACAQGKDDLVFTADTALLKAKESGRNCVLYYGGIYKIKSIQGKTA
ncbi:MAG: GGDEF domain-containing protein [Candidatus Aquicultor sp.]